VQLTVRDVAKLFSVSEDKIYKWIDNEALPARQVSHQYRFHRAELLEWATTHNIKVSGEIFNNKKTELPSLADAIEAGGIFHDVEGTDKESALRAIVSKMQLPDEVNCDTLSDLLLAREALGSTGVGDGIAIPHVRNPIVLHVPRASITLCFLKQPIDFGAADGQPVHTMFSLISPTIPVHLHLLSRLASALSDPAFKDVITRRATADKILAAGRRIEASLASAAAKSNLSKKTA
jgi:nitrogen PTS system EIIA component